MLLKEDVKNVILKMKKENLQYVKVLEQYISSIDKMADETFNDFLKKNNILTQEDIVNFVGKSIDEQINNRPENKFKKLNETIGYGVSDNTLHIHVMPAELKDALSKDGRKRISLELIDALEKIQNLINEDERYSNVEQIYAVSSILRGPILDIFKDLDFDIRCVRIKDAKTDEEFAKFYNKFKDGKYIGSAKIIKEKILSEEWTKLKEDIRLRLQKELNIVADKKYESKEQPVIFNELKKLTNSVEEVENSSKTRDDNKNKNFIDKNDITI